MITGTWRDAGHAEGLAIPGGSLTRGHRAGTRPAPTGPVGGILLARHFTLDTLLGKNEHGG